MFSNKYGTDFKSKTKNSAERKFKFAKLYHAYKDYEMAKQCIAEYLQSKPDSAAGHFLKGQIHEALGEGEKALNCYQKSLELDSNQKDALSHICQLLVRHPTDNDTMRFWVEKAEKSIPSDDNIVQLKQLVEDWEINEGMEPNGCISYEKDETVNSNRSYYFTPLSHRFGHATKTGSAEMQKISERIEDRLLTIIKNQEQLLKLMTDRETCLLQSSNNIVEAVQMGNENLKYLAEKVDLIQSTLEQIQIAAPQHYSTTTQHISPSLRAPSNLQGDSNLMQNQLDGNEVCDIGKYDEDYFPNYEDPGTVGKVETTDKYLPWPPATAAAATTPFSVQFKDCNFREAFQKAMNEAEKYDSGTGVADLSSNSKSYVSSVGDVSEDANKSNSMKPLSQLFRPPENSWECNACYVTNQQDAQVCVSCETPRPGSIIPASQTPLDFSMFKPPENSWQCETCYVVNLPNAQACASCETPKPGATSQPAKFDFKFGFSSTPSKGDSEPTVPSGTAQLPKPVFGNTPPMFSFGTGPLDNSTTGIFSNPMSKTLTESTDTYGSKSSETTQVGNVPQSVFGSTGLKFNFGSGGLENSSTGFFSTTDSKKFPDVFSNGANLAGDSHSTFQFGSSQNFSFKFEGIQNAKPSNAPKSPEKIHDESTDSVEHSQDDSLHFKPLIELPPMIEVKTGEEDEAVLFSERAKLYRYANGEWKERGIGEMKILHDTSKNRIRLLMRRDQVLKVCLNHYISPNLELTPKETAGDNKEAKTVKSFTWTAIDYSEGAGVAEVFAIRFKNSTIAENFRETVEKCKGMVDGENSESQKSPEDPECQIVYVKQPVSEDKIKMAAELKLPLSFYNYEFAKPCSGCRGCTDNMPVLYYEKQQSAEEKEQSAAETPSAGLFAVAVAEHGTSSSWSSKPEASLWNTAVPVPIFQSAKEETVEEDTGPGPDFKPVIPLPNLVEVKTGEENETALFVQRAKLYRYDAPTKQWKERGVGDFKILKHNDTGKCRLLLRRDQVYKIACNHYITKSLSFSPMQNSHNALCWTAIDFSEGTAVSEKLAVKFKNKALLDDFQKKVEEVQKSLDDE